MSLNEAAEIVRRNSVMNPGPYDRDEDTIARSILANTMLSELDPTPISEELLVENVWVQDRSRFFKGDHTIRKQAGGGWKISWYSREIFTLGELRTLLRLMGGGK